MRSLRVKRLKFAILILFYSVKREINLLYLEKLLKLNGVRNKCPAETRMRESNKNKSIQEVLKFKKINKTSKFIFFLVL